MKVFRVDIGRTLLVIADGDEPAIDVAFKNERRELVNDPESVCAREVTGLKDVPEVWHDCRPYGEGNEGHLSVAQLLEQDAQMSEQVSEEIEEFEKETYSGDDPVHMLLEDLRDWFRDDGFISGVHFDEGSMLQEIEKVLFRWPTPVGNDVTHDYPMTELTILQKATEAWKARADELQTRPASERLIVLDTRGRAYSRNDGASFKLQVPNPAFKDVFLMNLWAAEAAKTLLTKHYARFSPYCILDAYTYAQQQASETAEVLTRIRGVFQEEPVSDSAELEPAETPSEGFSP